MTNYIPHHRKKKEVLEKREIQLIRAINSNAPEDKILKAAEEVRGAQIRAINVKTSQIRPVHTNENIALLERWNAEVEEWLQKPAHEIVKEYGKLNSGSSENS